MNSLGSNASNFGAPPCFMSRTPSSGPISTSVTSTQVFLNNRTTRPAVVGGRPPAVSAQVYQRKPYTISLTDRSVTKEALFRNMPFSVTKTVNKVHFQSAQKKTGPIGDPQINLRPCGTDIKTDGCPAGDVTCPVDVFDFAETPGGQTVAAPYGQSRTSDAGFCCGGVLSLAPPMQSSAETTKNGNPGFIQKLLQGQASTVGFTLPASNVMGSFVGAAAAGSSPAQRKAAQDQGRFLWLAGQKTAYDSQNNIKGRSPYKSQVNPVIYTDGNADFYAQYQAV